MKDMSRRFFWIATVNLFTAVLIPICVLGIVVGFISTNALRGEIDRSFQAGMEHAVNELNSVTGDLERLNDSLTTNPAVTLRLKTAMQHASREGIHDDEFAVYNAVLDLIFASCRQNAYVDSGYIYYDDGGEYFISSKKRLTNLDEYPDVSWYESYLNAGMFERTWNEKRWITEEDGSRRELMTLYYRIFAGGSTGSDRGVLVMNMDQDGIERVLEGPEDKWEIAAFVMDESGQILFDSSGIQGFPAAQNLGGFIRGEFGDAWLRDGIQKQRITIEGKTYVCLTQKMNSFGWRLVRISPENSLYAVTFQVLLILSVTIGVTMLFGIIFAYQTAQRNSRDITGVIHAIQRAKQGQTAEKDWEADRQTYSQTLRSVVDTFLDKEYLTVQLADRRHHAKLLELQALQAQLNPHFLFNTMTTIQWKTIAMAGGRNAASDMIEYLSDILRYSLDADEGMATIRQEMEILDSYVAIQKIRYEERFEYTCDCEPGMEEMRVVRMLLQPLVENSIHHGISQEKSVLQVHTRIFKENDLLCVRIEDNGVGMDKEKLAAVRESLTSSKTERGRHIGLYNVNKRMMLTYGEAYTLQIDSEPGQGTTILLCLPLTDSSEMERESDEEES